MSQEFPGGGKIPKSHDEILENSSLDNLEFGRKQISDQLARLEKDGGSGSPEATDLTNRKIEASKEINRIRKSIQERM